MIPYGKVGRASLLVFLIIPSDRFEERHQYWQFVFEDVPAFMIPEGVALMRGVDDHQCRVRTATTLSRENE